MSTEYFLQIDNQQAGPFNLQQIGAMVVDGSVPVTTLFWKEGQADWEPLTQLGFEPPRTPAAPSIAPGPPPIRPPAFRSQGRPVPPVQPEICKYATLSIILGVGSFFFSIITAIPAVIYGHIALNRIKKSGGALTGRGLAIPGLILGYLWLCAVPLILAVIAVPAYEGIKNAALETKSMSQAKQIGLACQEYAGENHGNFPPSLDALFPKYLPDRSILASPLYPSDPEGYIYNSGLNTSSSPDIVLVEDKYAPAKHVRVVVMVDDSGKVIRNHAGASNS